VSRMNCFEFGT